MARQFPKFIFQNVTEAKSTGKFIVHTMNPYILFSVDEVGTQIKLNVLAADQSADKDTIIPIMKRAMNWYIATQRTQNTEEEVSLFPTGKTLNEAYEEMINTRGIHNELELTRGTVNNLRTYFENGSNLTDNKKKEQLLKVGWVIVQEEKWAKFKSEING